MEDISTAKVLRINECGHDEYWLRDTIYDDPSMLDLGDLQPISKERTQSQGGRLDLLLKDPEDNSMYEVELQLGETDEIHLIRTIEYWANEKRKWPKRSHTAVLVAERITNRFFNVVQLLSMSVPIIGIQANVVDIGGAKALHFTKVIDTYEEPEEAEAPQESQFDESYWVKNYPATLECAKWYRGVVERLYGDVPVRYYDSYISLVVGGVAKVWINKRENDRAFIQLKLGKDPEVSGRLSAEGISFTTHAAGTVNFNVNLQQLKDHAETHAWLTSKLSPENLKLARGQPVGDK